MDGEAGGAENYAESQAGSLAELSVPAVTQSAYSHTHSSLGSLLHWTKAENTNIKLWNVWIARRTCVSIFRDPSLVTSVAMQHESDERTRKQINEGINSKDPRWG